MAQKRQSAAQTLETIAGWRPALASVLQAFSPLLCAEEQLQQTLRTQFTSESRRLPSCDTVRLKQGVPLLADYSFLHFHNELVRAFSELSANMGTIPALQRDLSPYAAFFASCSEEQEDHIFRSVLVNDPGMLQETAGDLDAALLHFLSSRMVSCILKALVATEYGNREETPWDENNTWQQGYCPVCGSLPSLAWLDRPVIDERNTFLLEGGGRKHLYCGVCGAGWRFQRLACPVCGTAESKQMEILSLDTDAHGESIDWCHKCRCYCPTVDLRERDPMPDLDAEALGMLHLELLAREKDLKPLRTAFWNTFS